VLSDPNDAEDRATAEIESARPADTGERAAGEWHVLREGIVAAAPSVIGVTA